MSGCVFECQIIDAYSFRNLIAMVRELFLDMNISFVISEKEIRVTQTNANASMICDSVLFASELLKYRYDAVDEFGDPIEYITVTVSMSELFKALKPGGKKDSIIMSIHTIKKVLVINVISGSSKIANKTSCFFIPILEASNVPEYHEFTYERGANVKIHTVDFAKACASFNTIKCGSMEMEVYPAGVQCTGFLPGKRVGSITSFGEDKEQEVSQGENGKKILTIGKKIISSHEVTGSFIKAFSKIGNLANLGILSITAEEGKPIKLTCPISNFGKFNLSLIPKELLDEEEEKHGYD
jgi:hypothetical protein